MSVSITVVNLDNLPEGVTLQGDASRAGNVFTWNSSGGTFTISYFDSTSPEPPFAAGDVVQMAWNVDEWTSNNFRTYARGIPQSGGDVTGYCKWKVISGYTYPTPLPIGEDSNTAIRVHDAATCILEIEFTQPAWGFYVTSRPVNNDGSTGNGTGQVTFRYLTTQFEPVDPYLPGGTSDIGGGTGNFDLSSDAVDFPALPSLSAVSTGLVSVYTPTLAQLNSLANFLWNANPTDVDWWKKLVANPLDLVLGLSIVPVAVPAGAAQTIKVGLIDTGVSVTKASTQYVEVDCGSITVGEYWGSALDYSPFRRFSIYLPFIGTRTISTDDIMGKTVHVKYHIDLLSGACVAMVKCGDAVLYQYSGACAVSLPLTGETFTNIITSTIQLAASIGATVATGGAAAGVTASSAANSLMSMKPIVERAGGVSGAAGQLGVMTPYLVGEVPKQSVPENCNTFTGYPSNIKAVIGDLTGYTEVDIIHLENIPATSAEKSELESILKAGVIL